LCESSWGLKAGRAGARSATPKGRGMDAAPRLDLVAASVFVQSFVDSPHKDRGATDCGPKAH